MPPIVETGPIAERPASSSRDLALREFMREWRRSIAKRQGVPAYIVMHDTSLEELCRVQPRSVAALSTVTGFGERKIEAYGARSTRSCNQ